MAFSGSTLGGRDTGSILPNGSNRSCLGTADVLDSDPRGFLIMLLEPGTMLSHYRLIEKIGEGGMGVVYKALDTRLEREVALKFLPEEFANEPDRLARFIREAKTIAALNHPNIVGIHSVEEEDGVRFITMELVRGRTLKEVIPRKGLPTGELFALAAPMVEAVSVAHEQGITHRDLKPENIMVTPDGRVKILDLGLAMAKPLEPVTARSEVTTSIDETGLMIGTAACMSPEQVEGRRLDHRSDIFALGVILYEMATGQRPFRGTSSLEVISSIMHDTPAPLSDLNPLHPHELDRVVRHSLVKDRERRYQTAKDVRNDLDELKREMESGISAQTGPSRSRTRRAASVAGIAVIMAVIGLLSMDALRNPWGERRVLPRKNSVAVLPLKNLSADPRTNTSATALPKTSPRSSPRWGTCASSPARRLRATRTRSSATEIGSALGVATVLDGSVRRDRDRIRIVSQLLDGRTGEQLWSATYDRELKDIFAIQADVSRRLRWRSKAALVRGCRGPACAAHAGPRRVRLLPQGPLLLEHAVGRWLEAQHSAFPGGHRSRPSTRSLTPVLRTQQPSLGVRCAFTHRGWGPRQRRCLEALAARRVARRGPRLAGAGASGTVRVGCGRAGVQTRARAEARLRHSASLVRRVSRGSRARSRCHDRNPARPGARSPVAQHQRAAGGDSHPGAALRRSHRSARPDAADGPFVLYGAYHAGGGLRPQGA